MSFLQWSDFLAARSPFSTEPWLWEKQRREQKTQQDPKKAQTFLVASRVAPDVVEPLFRTFHLRPRSSSEREGKKNIPKWAWEKSRSFTSIRGCSHFTENLKPNFTHCSWGPGTSELHNCVVGTCSPTSKWKNGFLHHGAIDQSHDDGAKFRFTELILEVLRVYALASCRYSKKTKDSGENMKE